ncbi:MAG: hydantoinase/oxoprolinase family protein [Alphaproteobacteria bacterium]
MQDGWIIGLDIGGTFTDVVMTLPRTGRSARFKCLSTPDDPARGALDGVRGVLAEAGAEPEAVAVVLHATTLVSNALIERKGASTALLATQGFRDTLDIAREKKFDIYDVQIEKPAPLIPRSQRFELRERIAADGSAIEALDMDSVAAAADAIRACGAEAVAVCLLHAYMNPAHERAVRDALAERLDGIAVSLSSDILPEMREFERATTTAANAYVQPAVARYLRRFAEGLGAAGLRAPLFVMLSEGGIAAPDVVRRLPVRICESGPAAGAVTAAAVARQGRRKRVLSFDMGGTTAKSCLIHDGEPVVATEFEVARMYRMKKGSGLTLRVPVVDLIEIGAGGGSIVRVDALGLLKVGPDSVGADPGPACYGRGGTLPTVTDADLVLGYLDPGSFLGGRMRLDPEAARRAIATQVAGPLGLSLEAAALGIHAVVNENMANASRLQAVERGHDPAAHAMVAFGGAGPVHAWGVAQRLRIGTVIVPPSAGLGSALGLLLAPRSYRLARTFIATLDRLDTDTVAELFAAMEAEAAAALADAGVGPSAIRLRRRADMRYRGQRKELTVDLPAGPPGADGAAMLRRAFEAQYRRIYGRIHEGHPVEALCWRLEAAGPPIRRLGRMRGAIQAGVPAPIGHRPALFAGWEAPRPVAVYRRDALTPGSRIAGPALVEEAESTAVLGPGGTAEADAHGNLVLTLPKQERGG